MAEKKEKTKGNGSLFKIILLVLLVIIVLGIGFVGYLFMTNKNQANATVPKTASSITAENAAIEVSAYTYSLDEFLVNLSDEGGKKYFKVKIFLGYDTKKKKNMDKELEEKKPILRDAINSVLRSKKSTDLSSAKSIEDLKKEILARINPYFESGKASNIYFNDILIQ